VDDGFERLVETEQSRPAFLDASERIRDCWQVGNVDKLGTGNQLARHLVEPGRCNRAVNLGTVAGALGQLLTDCIEVALYRPNANVVLLGEFTNRHSVDSIRPNLGAPVEDFVSLGGAKLFRTHGRSVFLALIYLPARTGNLYFGVWLVVGACGVWLA
jgi:hypothetical protein